jgi:hypothetical protein
MSVQINQKIFPINCINNQITHQNNIDIESKKNSNSKIIFNKNNVS